MYAYKKFNGVLKSFVRNRAYPKGSMVQGYYTEEAIEWALNYADPTNPIGVTKSRHEIICENMVIGMKFLFSSVICVK
jgi:hypothetical protein